MEIKILGDRESDWPLLKRPWIGFFRNEPINSGVAAFSDPKNDDTLYDVLHSCVTYAENNPIIYAWDSEKQQTAGMVMTLPLYKELPAELKGKDPMPWRDDLWDADSMKQLKALDNFLDTLRDKGDVYTKYGVDKALLIHITSVCPEYTRRGLANTMTERVLNEAKDAGYEIVMSVSTSAYTQRSKIKNFGFEVALEMNFENNYSLYQNMSQEQKTLHTKGCILVKRL